MGLLLRRSFLAYFHLISRLQYYIVAKGIVHFRSVSGLCLEKEGMMRGIIPVAHARNGADIMENKTLALFDISSYLWERLEK